MYVGWNSKSSTAQVADYSYHGLSPSNHDFHQSHSGHRNACLSNSEIILLTGGIGFSFLFLFLGYIFRKRILSWWNKIVFWWFSENGGNQKTRETHSESESQSNASRAEISHANNGGNSGRDASIREIRNTNSNSNLENGFGGVNLSGSSSSSSSSIINHITADTNGNGPRNFNNSNRAAVAGNLNFMNVRSVYGYGSAKNCDDFPDDPNDGVHWLAGCNPNLNNGVGLGFGSSGATLAGPTDVLNSTNNDINLNNVNITSLAHAVAKIFANAKFQHDERKILARVVEQRREEQIREEQKREEEKRERETSEERAMKKWKSQVQAMNIEDWRKLLEKQRELRGKGPITNSNRDSRPVPGPGVNQNGPSAVAGIGYPDVSSLSNLITRVGGGVSGVLGGESCNNNATLNLESESEKQHHLSLVELSRLESSVNRGMSMIAQCNVSGMRTEGPMVPTVAEGIEKHNVVKKVDGSNSARLDANRAGFGGGDSKSTGVEVIVDKLGSEDCTGERENIGGDTNESGKRLSTLCDSKTFPSSYHEADSTCSDIMKKHELQHGNQQHDRSVGGLGLGEPNSSRTNNESEDVRRVNISTNKLDNNLRGKAAAASSDLAGLGVGEGQHAGQNNQIYKNEQALGALGHRALSSVANLSTAQSMHHAGATKSMVDHTKKHGTGDDFRKYMMAKGVVIRNEKPVSSNTSQDNRYAMNNNMGQAGAGQNPVSGPAVDRVLSEKGGSKVGGGGNGQGN